MVEIPPSKDFEFHAYCKENGMTKAGAVRRAIKKVYGIDVSI